MVQRIGQHITDGMLELLEGNLIFRKVEVSGAPSELHEEALECFRAAIEISRRQNAKLWELRGTMSLARLLICEGQRDEARDTLAPVYGWFTEGFDTADSKDAKALLDELSG